MNPAPYDADGQTPVVLTGINPLDLSLVAIAPPGTPYYKTFKMAFAPRFGVAYVLNQKSGRETVLRGGFGVYYDLGNGWASSLFGQYPFVRSININNVSFPLSPELAQPPPFDPVPTQVTPQLRGRAFNALDPNLRLPYTLGWSAALEQSLGKSQTVTLSYVASAGRRLTTRLFLNARANPFSAAARPNPNLGDISYVTNGPTSDYHSMQVQFQRRLSRGLQALVNYTWAHAIDEVSNEFNFGQLERGSADFDVRHNFSAGITYDLPKFRGTNAFAGLIKAIANGWSLDSVLYARTGTPINLTGGVNITRADGTLMGVRPDVILGVPFWIKDASVPGGQRLNPAAFIPPPSSDACPPDGCFVPTRQGTLGRNVVYLPAIHQVNVALRRQFKLGERMNLQVKAEAFNTLNHPLFANYTTSVDFGDFGVPQSMLNSAMGGLSPLYQLGGPRSMQFSVRLSF
jgi:hypothetical protein